MWKSSGAPIYTQPPLQILYAFTSRSSEKLHFKLLHTNPSRDSYTNAVWFQAKIETSRSINTQLITQQPFESGFLLKRTLKILPTQSHHFQVAPFRPKLSARHTTSVIDV